MMAQAKRTSRFIAASPARPPIWTDCARIACVACVTLGMASSRRSPSSWHHSDAFTFASSPTCREFSFSRPLKTKLTRRRRCPRSTTEPSTTTMVSSSCSPVLWSNRVARPVGTCSTNDGKGSLNSSHVKCPTSVRSSFAARGAAISNVWLPQSQTFKWPYRSWVCTTPASCMAATRSGLRSRSPCCIWRTTEMAVTNSRDHLNGPSAEISRGSCW